MASLLSPSFLIQVAVLLLLVKLGVMFYGLLKQRWHLQELTKDFETGGMKTNWLLGDMHHMPPDGQKRMETIVSWMRQVETMGRIWIGPFIASLLAVGPDYVRAVLTNADSKNNLVYDSLRPWLGDGLLTSSGEKWMRHRRLLTPAFHYEILKPYVKIFGDSTDVSLNKLSDSKGKYIDIFQPVSLMTLDSLLKCSFSYDSKCQHQESPYIKAVYEIASILTKRFRFFPYHFDIIFNLSPIGRRFIKQCKIVHEKAETTIRERKQELTRKLTAPDESVKMSGRRRKYLDFLDILIEAKDENGAGLSDLEIREEVDTFMFEGHDTTASGISWCLYSLATHPEYQQKCREEIEQIMCHKENEELDWNDLSHLEFTTMCIKESLRLFPPVPNIARTLIKDITLPNGIVLPKGTFVGVGPFITHRHTSFWENPDVFDPYRFSAENSRDRHSHAYVPFSAGPRNCIGKQFAMNEMKVVITKTIHRFHIASDPHMIPEPINRLVLKAFDGIYLKFTDVQTKLEHFLF